jgi:hypothetical protein
VAIFTTEAKVKRTKKLKISGQVKGQRQIKT